jgi:hypothetical protein
VDDLLGLGPSPAPSLPTPPPQPQLSGALGSGSYGTSASAGRERAASVLLTSASTVGSVGARDPSLATPVVFVSLLRKGTPDKDRSETKLASAFDFVSRGAAKGQEGVGGAAAQSRAGWLALG